MIFRIFWQSKHCKCTPLQIIDDCNFSLPFAYFLKRLSRSMSVSLYKKSILLDIALIECTRHVGRFNSENGVVFLNCDILLHPIGLIFLGSVIIPQHPHFFFCSPIRSNNITKRREKYLRYQSSFCNKCTCMHVSIIKQLEVNIYVVPCKKKYNKRYKDQLSIYQIVYIQPDSITFTNELVFFSILLVLLQKHDFHKPD